MIAERSSTLVSTMRGGVSDTRLVTGADVRLFCGRLVGHMLDGDVREGAEFALGFAAAIDAMASDSIDWGDPLDTVLLARADVHRIGGECEVTDFMRQALSDIGAAR